MCRQSDCQLLLITHRDHNYINLIVLEKLLRCDKLGFLCNGILLSIIFVSVHAIRWELCCSLCCNESWLVVHGDKIIALCQEADLWPRLFVMRTVLVSQWWHRVGRLSRRISYRLFLRAAAHVSAIIISNNCYYLNTNYLFIFFIF